MKHHVLLKISVIALVLYQVHNIDGRRAGPMKRYTATVPPSDDSDEADESPEADDDGRIYKNPRNSPSALCPRDEEQATLLGQKCLRKCSSDEDCKSKKKKCLCDGACGMSCIKPGVENQCNLTTSVVNNSGSYVTLTLICNPELVCSGNSGVCVPAEKCDYVK